MAEGWFCPGCQAYHSPDVDSCDLAVTSERFACNICDQKSDMPIRCERSDCLTMYLVNGLASRAVY